MAISASRLQQYYVAYYGRPADAVGADYWTKISNQPGFSELDLVTNFGAGAQPEFANLYGGKGNAGFINAVYNNLFNRDVDVAGLNYWIGVMNDAAIAGEDANLTRAKLVSFIMDGAQPSDAAILANKVSAAEAFSSHVDTVAEIAAYSDVNNTEALQAGRDWLKPVDDADSLAAALGTIDATLAAIVDGGGPVAGDTFRLTINDDTIVATGNSDVIVGRIGTVDGVEANSLNSGDVIDGGGLVDTLTAQVMPGAAQQGTEIRPIQPLISNVENIKLEAQYRDITESSNPDLIDLFLRNQPDLDGHTGGENGVGNNGAVPVFNYNVDDSYIRATEIADHKELWSYNSTGDLILQDVTTLTSGGLVRNTSDLTIGMAYTGNGDSHWDESDYKVYFDQDYLIPRQLNQGSTMYFELMDMDSALTGGNPLETNPFGAIVFKIGGVEHTLTFGTNAKTYAQLLADVQAALAADPAFANLTAAIGPKFTATDTDTDPGGSTQGDTIIITNHGPEELQATGVQATRLLPPDTDYHKQFTNLPPGTENIPVEINVALEKVGDSGDGGELVIGSMNKGEFDGNSLDGIDVNTYNDTTEGFEKFNVTVYGDSEKPSSLAKLRSTNNTLETVIVKSEARTDGSYADLIIGNSNTGDVDIALAAAVAAGGGVLTDFYGLRDVKTWDSTAFLGDASLWAGLTPEMSAKYGNPQYDVNYDFGIGNDSLHLDIDENGNQALNVNVAMGEGDDSADVHIDGDAVDAVTESFEIALGNGNNSLYVSIDREMQDDDLTFGDPTADGNNNGLFLETTDLLKNLSITSGSGVDTVEVVGLGNFDIQVGADSDFVYIHNGGLNAGGNLWDEDGDNPDGWAFPDWETAATNLLAPRTTNGIALYNAKLSIRAAGFESTVDIVTGPDFIATTQDINNAIIAAIAASPELKRLIEAEVGTTDQDLIVRSLVDGENQAELIIFQPELVASNAHGSQVVLSASHVNTLAAALIATGRAIDSNDIDDASTSGTDPDGDHIITTDDIVLYFADAPAFAINEYGDGHGPLAGVDSSVPGLDGLHGTILYAFSNEGGDEGGVINNSVINMGAGANDLVVLSSQDASSNTLVFDAAWGKVSIVNWFENEAALFPNAGIPFLGPVTPGAVTANGLHKLDFTAFLTNTTSSSGSPLSATPIAITSNNQEGMGGGGGNQFTANNIVIVNVDDLEDTGNANLSFASLTNVQVAAALNEVGGYSAANQSAGGPPNVVVETTRTSLLFVENVDTNNLPTDLTNETPEFQEFVANLSGTSYGNYGEYKVYQVTYADGFADTNFTVSLLGTLDFGNSLVDYSLDGVNQGNINIDANLVNPSNATFLAP